MCKTHVCLYVFFFFNVFFKWCLNCFNKKSFNVFPPPNPGLLAHLREESIYSALKSHSVTSKPPSHLSLLPHLLPTNQTGAVSRTAAHSKHYPSSNCSPRCTGECELASSGTLGQTRQRRRKDLKFLLR